MAVLSQFLPARYSHFWVSVFQRYLRWILRKDFHRIELCGQIETQDGPIVLICNHSSWWDGFWMDHLNRLVLKKRMFMLMLETELKKRPFFRRVGAFSIQPGSRTALQSLAYAQNVLRSSDAAVLIFPQGKIEDPWVEEIRFQKGLFRILEKAASNVRLVMAHCQTSYSAHRKPTLQIHYREIPRTDVSEEGLERLYNDWVRTCRSKSDPS